MNAFGIKGVYLCLCHKRWIGLGVLSHKLGEMFSIAYQWSLVYGQPMAHVFSLVDIQVDWAGNGRTAAGIAPAHRRLALPLRYKRSAALDNCSGHDLKRHLLV